MAHHGAPETSTNIYSMADEVEAKVDTYKSEIALSFFMIYCMNLLKYWDLFNNKHLYMGAYVCWDISALYITSH